MNKVSYWPILEGAISCSNDSNSSLIINDIHGKKDRFRLGHSACTTPIANSLVHGKNALLILMYVSIVMQNDNAGLERNKDI